MTRDEAIALIRKQRLNRGLSQSEAARLCGMTPEQWHQSESPKMMRRCRPETILRMARAVGIVMDYDQFIVREQPASQDQQPAKLRGRPEADWVYASSRRQKRVSLPAEPRQSDGDEQDDPAGHQQPDPAG